MRKFCRTGGQMLQTLKLQYVAIATIYVRGSLAPNSLRFRGLTGGRIVRVWLAGNVSVHHRGKFSGR